jgi:hypothetical protein
MMFGMQVAPSSITIERLPARMRRTLTWLLWGSVGLLSVDLIIRYGAGARYAHLLSSFLEGILQQVAFSLIAVSLGLRASVRELRREGGDLVLVRRARPLDWFWRSEPLLRQPLDQVWLEWLDAALTIQDQARGISITLATGPEAEEIAAWCMAQGVARPVGR